MIEIFVTSFDTELPAATMERQLDSLPAFMRQSIVRYKRWQDRQRALLAKLLLRAGLRSLGFSAAALDLVRLDAYGRPSICREVDFNISHSESYILCAMARGQRVGIDIEAIRDIDLDDFSAAFTPDQWDAIRHAPNPHAAFFRDWTRKESASKADGRGLSIPLAQIALDNRTALVDSTPWQLVSLQIHPAYCCHLATDGPIDCMLAGLDCHGDLMAD